MIERPADRHVFVPLPFLTERQGRPWFARVPLRFGAADDSPVDVPRGSAVIKIRVPDARIIAYMPDKVPGGDCYDKADAAAQAKADVGWQVWADRFLAESIEEPAMSLAQVQGALGTDRDAIVMALLRLWNWLPVEDAYPHMPNATVQQGLRIMAKRSGRLPSELLMSPLDAFTLDWRTLRVFAPPGKVEAVEDDGPDPSDPFGLRDLPESMIDRGAA